MANAAPPTTAGTLLQRSEMLLSLALLGLLVIFLVPLPTLLLDMLLALNLGATILLLLVTLTVRQPLEFSTFWLSGSLLSAGVWSSAWSFS